MLDTRIATFLCVCKYMNFTKAATELNLTQPAVSKQIKFLEGYYNTKLFSYSKKTLSLTPQGIYLKNTMETFYHDSARIKDEITRINNLKSIHIGATMSIGNFYLPDKLSLFIKKHPELTISVTINDTASLLSALDAGQIDFILCEGYFDKEKYDSFFIRQEKIICVCSPDYGIHSPCRIKDLFSHKILLREEGSGTREVLERKLATLGYSLNDFKNQCILSSPSLIVKMLLDNNGISFLYESVIKEELENHCLSPVSISNFDLNHEFNAVWKRGSIFTDAYNEYIKELVCFS